MVPFIIRRLFWTIPVLIVATLITFTLVSFMPYRPFDVAGRRSEQLKQNLNELFGFDQSFLRQYLDFLGDLVRLDFGISTKPGFAPVGEVMADLLPTSLLLGIMAFAFAAVLGTLFGVVSALWANRSPDYVATVISTAAFAIPSFVIATLWVNYVDVFGISYGWDDWGERLGPIIVLGLSIMPYFTRLIRASMLEALENDYVVTARAKGLPWRRTISRHVLRNSLIPTVTNAGPLFGFVLTGSFIIETIMIVPGIAGEFVKSAQTPLDPRMILGTTVLLSGIIILMNLVVDIIVAKLDPRITYE